MTTTVAGLTSGDLVRHYRRRTLSPVEVVTDVLARIGQARAFNAFVSVDADGALSGARDSEARWRCGAPIGRVDGVPATIKDNIWVRGMPTLKGSKTVDRIPAPEDAPAVARLREQGAIILGKTAMPE